MRRPTIKEGDQAPGQQPAGRQTAVRKTSFVLQTKAADAHANPFIQDAKSPVNLCHPEVIGVSSDDRVQVLEDGLDIPTLLSAGHVSDTVFELFKGTRSNTKVEAPKVKPQELETLAKTRKTSFCLMEREAERSQDLLGVNHSKSGFFWRFRENDKVIGVSHMAPTLGFDILIKGVEDHVGEQRRDDAPLRSTLSRDADDATVTDTGFEEGLEKSNDTAICDP